MHSATSGGATSNVAAKLAARYPQQTIFDSLYKAGLDFGIYYQNIPATLFCRNLRKLKYVPKFHLYDLSFKPSSSSTAVAGVKEEEGYICDVGVVAAG
uniref:Uncharacterized protein n=1 Tax=Cajanus cajan TaxID=3821 RepID=A0A151TH76_CAJCA|nr:hypothetical protein KK1_012704 [Cajanus cajan]